MMTDEHIIDLILEVANKLESYLGIEITDIPIPKWGRLENNIMGEYRQKTSSIIVNNAIDDVNMAKMTLAHELLHHIRPNWDCAANTNIAMQLFQGKKGQKP